MQVVGSISRRRAASDQFSLCLICVTDTSGAEWLDRSQTDNRQRFVRATSGTVRPRQDQWMLLGPGRSVVIVIMACRFSYRLRPGAQPDWIACSNSRTFRAIRSASGPLQPRATGVNCAVPTGIGLVKKVTGEWHVRSHVRAKAERGWGRPINDKDRGTGLPPRCPSTGGYRSNDTHIHLPTDPRPGAESEPLCGVRGNLA